MLPCIIIARPRLRTASATVVPLNFSTIVEPRCDVGRYSSANAHVTVTDAHLFPEHMLSEDDIRQTADSHSTVYTT